MEKRREQLLEMLREQVFMTVTAMSKALFASEATIRRDLIALEKLGLIRRAHGGAEILNPKQVKPVWTLNARQDVSAKRKIAQQAASLVQDGSVLYLDSSSTAKHVLPFLQNKKLTIFTNCLETATQAAEMGLDTFLTGGQVNAVSRCCQGAMVQRLLGNVYVDLMFFSVTALSETGELTHNSAEAVDILRAMMSRCRASYLLCASSKLGHHATYSVCNCTELSGVIAETKLPGITNQLPIPEEG